MPRKTSTKRGTPSRATAPPATPSLDYGQFHDGLTLIITEGIVLLGPKGSSRMVRAELTRFTSNRGTVCLHLSCGTHRQQEEFNVWIDDLPANEVGALVEALTGVVRQAIADGMLPAPVTASGDIIYPFEPDDEAAIEVTHAE